MRSSAPRLAAVVLAACVRAFPERWLTHESGATDGSCGELISEAGQSGMGTLGYTHIGEKDDTVMLSGGVATFVTPPGNQWFATATSGTFGGNGSASSFASVECGQFRYGALGGTTVTWTPSGTLSGTASLQIGYTAGYATVNYYELTVSSTPVPPGVPEPPPSPRSPPLPPSAPPASPSPPLPPLPPSAPSASPSPPPAPSVPLGTLAPPSAPQTCAVSSRAEYDCMVVPPGGAQGYVLHWTVAGADVRLLAETTASGGWIAVGWSRDGMMEGATPSSAGLVRVRVG